MFLPLAARQSVGLGVEKQGERPEVTHETNATLDHAQSASGPIAHLWLISSATAAEPASGGISHIFAPEPTRGVAAGKPACGFHPVCSATIYPDACARG